MENFNLYFDGSIDENPGGNMGWGYVLYKGAELIHKDSSFKLKAVDNSNNVSEYLGLLDGLLTVMRLCPKDSYIKVYGDSDLVIKQMSGKWRIKEGSYFGVALATNRIIKSIKNDYTINFIWIPRERNEEADKQSRLALDVYKKKRGIK